MVSPELSKPVDIVFKTVISLLLIADLVGNGLVILVILSSRPMKTPMNYLLINLALADIMVAIFMAPSFVMSDFTHPDGATGDLLCKTVTGSNLAWVGGFASVLSLVFIAVERYYAVLHPFSIQYKFTTKRIKILVLVGWIIAVIMELPEFIFETYQKDTLFKCEEIWPKNWHAVLYGVVWLFLAGLLPITIMCVLYYRIIRSLWLKVDDHMNGDLTRQAAMRSRKQITKMMITVSVIFSLCWLPVLIIYITQHVHPGLMLHEDITTQVSYGLVAFNSSFNPFLYTLQFEKFKKRLRILICSWRSNPQKMRRKSTRQSLINDQEDVQDTPL